jgi:flagellar hook-associated protein 3 FlgL
MTQISTLQLNSLSLGSALSVETQYAQAETKQATGLVATDFGTLGGASASEMLNLEDGIAQSQTWASNATTVGSSTQAMYTSLGNMSSTMSTLESKISAATSTADNSNLLAAVQQLQQTLVTQMNTQQAGSYLFAGTNVGKAPVDLTNYPWSNVSVSNSSTAYYTGDSNTQSVRISQQQTVDYGMPASSTGFEEALRATQAVIQAAGTLTAGTITATDPTNGGTNSASVTGGDSFTINGLTVNITTTGESLNAIAQDINTAAQGATPASSIAASVVNNGGTYSLQVSSGSSAGLTFGTPVGTSLTNLGLTSVTSTPTALFQSTMKAALGVATSAVTNLADMQASVAAKSAEISSAHDQQTTYVTYLQNSLSGVKDVDTAQVAAQVSQYQTQLQASYLAVAQISKVNLAQYL